MNLAEQILQRGLVTAEQLQQAKDKQVEDGGSLGRALLALGFVTEKDLYRLLAEQLNHPFFDFDEEELDPHASTLVGRDTLERYLAIPVRFDGDSLVVAMPDPYKVDVIDNIATLTGRSIVPVVALKSAIIEAIEKTDAMSKDIDAIADSIELDEDDEDDPLSGLQSVNEEAPIVKFVNTIITKAVTSGASDIHVEPGEKDLRVRYRIDGVLHEELSQPKRFTPAVTSRLKIMADVDIAEKRIPQDGRFSVNAAGKKIDMRFSTLPTVYGEKIVMRILDTSSVLLTLDDLGFLPHNEEMYKASYTKPYGMILVTGPTGSGKSTTLYATVNVVNQPGVNITTTEDPVEYRLAGVNQVPVNNKVGMTFAAALRAILRQDPDIVLVGEMRDRETAQIGVEAALTGHLVLSTLHTNDAPSAITRLTEMGIEPFLVASAVDCVLAQRLARRVCSKCMEWEEVSEEALLNAGFSESIAAERPPLPRAMGCKVCSDTGYKGRLAVHEVMPMSEEIERLTVERASSDFISDVAQKQGMRTLREDGLAKVMTGITTVEEVSRIIV